MVTGFVFQENSGMSSELKPANLRKSAVFSLQRKQSLLQVVNFKCAVICDVIRRYGAILDMVSNRNW